MIKLKNSRQSHKVVFKVHQKDKSEILAICDKDLLGKKLIDYIAMDVKTPLVRYKDLVGVEIANEIKKSIDLIKKSGLGYEFRTTVLPRIFGMGDFEKMGKMVEDANKFYIQNFRPGETLNPDFKNERRYTEKET